eukprot:scaffold20343_cov103-Isochrysis_galbana.AAC.4
MPACARGPQRSTGAPEHRPSRPVPQPSAPQRPRRVPLRTLPRAPTAPPRAAPREVRPPHPRAPCPLRPVAQPTPPLPPPAASAAAPPRSRPCPPHSRPPPRAPPRRAAQRRSERRARIVPRAVPVVVLLQRQLRWPVPNASAIPLHRVAEPTRRVKPRDAPRPPRAPPPPAPPPRLLFPWLPRLTLVPAQPPPPPPSPRAQAQLRVLPPPPPPPRARRQARHAARAPLLAERRWLLTPRKRARAPAAPRRRRHAGSSLAHTLAPGGGSPRACARSTGRIGRQLGAPLVPRRPLACMCRSRRREAGRVPGLRRGRQLHRLVPSGLEEPHCAAELRNQPSIIGAPVLCLNELSAQGGSTHNGRLHLGRRRLGPRLELQHPSARRRRLLLRLRPRRLRPLPHRRPGLKPRLQLAHRSLCLLQPPLESNPCRSLLCSRFGLSTPLAARMHRRFNRLASRVQLAPHARQLAFGLSRALAQCSCVGYRYIVDGARECGFSICTGRPLHLIVSAQRRQVGVAGLGDLRAFCLHLRRDGVAHRSPAQCQIRVDLAWQRGGGERRALRPPRGLRDTTARRHISPIGSPAGRPPTPARPAELRAPSVPPRPASRACRPTHSPQPRLPLSPQPPRPLPQPRARPPRPPPPRAAPACSPTPWPARPHRRHLAHSVPPRAPPCVRQSRLAHAARRRAPPHAPPPCAPSRAAPAGAPPPPLAKRPSHPGRDEARRGKRPAQTLSRRPRRAWRPALSPETHSGTRPRLRRALPPRRPPGRAPGPPPARTRAPLPPLAPKPPPPRVPPAPPQTKAPARERPPAVRVPPLEPRCAPSARPRTRQRCARAQPPSAALPAHPSPGTAPQSHRAR